MQFHPGPIDGVIWRPLRRNHDSRGWLCELFRHDELDAAYHPAMAYFSMTEPGVARGPHEHAEQADCFCFLGPSSFKVYLWDARPASPTFGVKQIIYAGQDSPTMVLVPPGVVHAYKNVGLQEGVVFNGPNRLYAGPGKRESAAMVFVARKPD